MRISARVQSGNGQHQVTVTTEGKSHALAIAPKPNGLGSATNGGELLTLALATCYCNDLYREATAAGIRVHEVEVECDAKFGGPGEPASRIEYRVRVRADASEERIRELVAQTDRMAEVHNTLRGGIAVQLAEVEVSGTTGG
jgi:organic hydroperoxide reductase OsmC/OhrA